MPKYINVNIERVILSKERIISATILSMESTFQEWLSKQLEQRGWTQNQLAQRAGLASGTLSNIMSGNRKISFDTCVSIAEALSLPAEVVVREAGLLPQNKEQPPGFLEWMGLFLSANEEQREEMLDYARFKAQRHKKSSQNH